MKNSRGNIERLVIEAHPGARVTYELVQQLVKEIPLRSPEQFRERLGGRGLKLAGTTLSAQGILRYLPHDVFPIRDAKDLVTKVAAATRLAVDVMARADQLPADRAREALVKTLASEPRQQGVAVGYFGGPSLFASKRTRKAGNRKGA